MSIQDKQAYAERRMQTFGTRAAYIDASELLVEIGSILDSDMTDAEKVADICTVLDQRYWEAVEQFKATTARAA